MLELSLFTRQSHATWSSFK